MCYQKEKSPDFCLAYIHKSATSLFCECNNRKVLQDSGAEAYWLVLLHFLTHLFLDENSMRASWPEYLVRQAIYPDIPHRHKRKNDKSFFRKLLMFSFVHLSIWKGTWKANPVHRSETTFSELIFWWKIISSSAYCS